MYQLLMNGSTVGLLFQVIPVVLVVGGIYALSRFALCRQKGEHFSHQKIIDCLFVCYLTGMISLTLVPNNLWTALWFYIYNGYPGCIIGPLLVPNFNFTPTIFLWLKGEIIPGKWVITMLLLNFLMFLPMGVFLPQEFKGLHNKNIIATAVAISAIIELIQPIIGRSFDVDDIVMNSLGIICGRVIFAVIERKTAKGCDSLELLKKFQELAVDTSWIGLTVEDNSNYFCTPVGASIIGWDNGIHYCFIRGFGEMVFAVNPDTCCEYYVYPLAKNFSDFLRLILATKNTNTMQQIILWNKQQYHDFISSPDEIKYHAKKEVKDALEAIRGLGILPMEHPFEYIKNIQTGFDYTQIPFSDEFYDVTGLEKPQ